MADVLLVIFLATGEQEQWQGGSSTGHQTGQEHLQQR